MFRFWLNVPRERGNGSAWDGIAMGLRGWPAIATLCRRSRQAGVTGQLIYDARWPVSRVLSSTLPSNRPGRMDGHSSGTSVTGRLARPTRTTARKCALPISFSSICARHIRGLPAGRPYLVLLPVGFTVPLPLPGARCALTAPFHPSRPADFSAGRRFAFCGTFPGVAPAGRYPAPYFRGARTFLPPARASRSGHPAIWRHGKVGTLYVECKCVGEYLNFAGVMIVTPDSTGVASQACSLTIRSRRSNFSRVSESAAPSQQAGRKCRWKATTAAVTDAASATS